MMLADGAPYVGGRHSFFKKYKLTVAFPKFDY